MLEWRRWRGSVSVATRGSSRRTWRPSPWTRCSGSCQEFPTTTTLGARGAVGYGDVVGLHLSQIDEADELLTSDPLALLLIGMVLDQ